MTPIDTGAGADVDSYIDDVMAGRVITGELEKLMVERQLRDIETGAERGLIWEPALGLIVIEFCEMLQHSKGKWAGKRLELEPWQKFLVTTLYGWIVAEDGTRRYRRAYWEVARKNGKSTLAAALALFALVADGEGGPEVYCGATKREQARIIFEESRRMATKSRILQDAVTVHQHSIFVPGTAGRFVPLSADDKHASGHNTHFAIMDELHEHRTDELWNVIATSMGSREQPLLLATTTAGEDPKSLCGRERISRSASCGAQLSQTSFFRRSMPSTPRRSGRTRPAGARPTPTSEFRSFCASCAAWHPRLPTIW